eukprot:g82033.t1
MLCLHLQVHEAGFVLLKVISRVPDCPDIFWVTKAEMARLLPSAAFGTDSPKENQKTDFCGGKISGRLLVDRHALVEKKGEQLGHGSYTCARGVSKM